MDPAGLEEQLRVEVRRLKTLNGTRRLVPAELHVGDLAGARLVVPLTALGADDDVALAVDVLQRAFDRLAPEAPEDRAPTDPQVWVTRGGDLTPGDRDWRWRAATTVVRRRHDRDPGSFHVVTRHGWLELPSEVSRRWARMRATWRAPYDDDRADAGPDPLDGWPIMF